MLDAVRAKIGAGNVVYVPGTSFDQQIDVAAAVEAAHGVDAIILCLGEKAYCETPGNIDDLTLDRAQSDLADALARPGKPIILVVLEGRPRVIRTIVDDAKSGAVHRVPSRDGRWQGDRQYPFRRRDPVRQAPGRTRNFRMP